MRVFSLKYAQDSHYKILGGFEVFMKKNKWLVAIMSIIMVFTVMYGCGSTGGGSGASTPGTLSIWSVAPLTADYTTILKTNKNDKQSLFTKYVVDTFSEKHNVKIRLYNKGWGDTLNENINTAISGNKLPDIVCGEIYMPEYVRNGHFMELDLPENEHIIGAAKEYGSQGDKIYAVPAWTGTFALAVNTNVLKEVGILDQSGVYTGKYDYEFSPLAPATWEQLLRVCIDIKQYYTDNKSAKKGGMLISNSKEGSAWRAQQFMLSAGGAFVDSAGKINLDTPQNVKAFELMRSLSKTGPEGSVTAENEDAVWDFFFHNQAAYIVDGIDVVTRVVNFPDYVKEGDIVTAEVPVWSDGGNKANMMVGTVYYGIPKTSKNQDLAKQFLQYLLSEEIQLKVMESDMRIPVIDTVLNGDKIKTISTYNAMANFLKPLTDNSYDFSGGLPAFSNNPAQIWERWQTFSNNLLKTDSEVSGLVSAAHKDMLAYQDRQ